MQTTDELQAAGGPAIRRLLAVNLNFLGDALFTTPALALLRARYPEARIDVLVGERPAAILAGNPNIDRVLLRPRRSGSARAMNFARTLRADRYDAVVLFQSITANAVISWLGGVPVRVGFSQDGCAPFLTHRVPARQPGEHVVDAYLRLAKALPAGASTTSLPTPALSIALDEEDNAFAERAFHDRELLPPVVGLVIGATRPQKRWPEEYWIRLAEKLWTAGNISCVLLGGPEETEAAQRILARTRETPLSSLVGRTTEKQLAAVIAQLGLVVSGDTGPLHIATAVRTPVVALFGSTDPADTGPWQGAPESAPTTVLYDALSCAPCRKNPTCNGRFDCLQVLTPERVFDAAWSLLGMPSRRTPLPVLPTSTSATPTTSAVASPGESLPTTAAGAGTSSAEGGSR